jgi:hypothetical protein
MLALNKIHGTSELVMLEGTHPTRTISIGGEWTETTRTYIYAALSCHTKDKISKIGMHGLEFIRQKILARIKYCILEILTDRKLPLSLTVSFSVLQTNGCQSLSICCIRFTNH